MKKKIVLVLLFLVLCLSACTKKESYIINFDSDGGTFIEAQNVNEGDKVVKPANPVKDGKELIEWQLNGEAYDFDLPVKESFTLKAVYTKLNVCSIIIDGQTYKLEWEGDEVPEVSNPIGKDGKVFKGWKVDGKEAPLSSAVNGSVVEAIFIDGDIPCVSINSEYNSFYAYEGTGAWKLPITVSPEDTTDELTFKSDDENVVKVDNQGNVTAQKAGVTKIHITCGDIKKDIKFETKAKKVEATEILVSPASMKLYVDATNFLTVTVKPENSTSEIKYSSSDNSIATVSDKGIVRGVAPGVATITIKAGDQSAVCSVCVEGETVVFEMQNNVSVQAGSHAKIPFKATHIACYDFVVNKTDVTTYVEFHTAYTSALINDGAGNIEAAGAVYETVDIPVYFTYTDGSMFFVQSPTFNVHVEK